MRPPLVDGQRILEAGAVGAEEHPGPDVEPDLQRVDGEGGDGGAVALHGPRAAHHPALDAEGLPVPLERVVGRGDRIEQAHGEPGATRTRRA